MNGTHKTTVTLNNVSEMVGFLKTNGTTCCFVSILSDTPVEKLRKDCPYKGVRKVARRNGWLNINYNMSVRRRIAERLDVELKEVQYDNGTTWYQHVMTEEGKALPLCVNKKTPDSGKYYIQYFPRKSKSQYVLPNGDPIDENLLKPYFYKESERSDFKPAVITISLENVKELRVRGLILKTPSAKVAEAVLATA